jgi:ATP-dependent Zn protease
MATALAGFALVDLRYVHVEAASIDFLVCGFWIQMLAFDSRSS